MKKNLSPLTILAVFSLLSACGVKGALTHPEPQHPAQETTQQQ